MDVTAASVVGRNHRLMGRNNQDAYHWASVGDRLVAVVCDGCGSGCHSEVGAGLAARLVASALLGTEGGENSVAAQFEDVRLAILAGLQPLAAAMGGCFAETIHDYFLFTVVGALVTSEMTTFFAIGDGVLLVNGEPFPLGPFANNAPPYMAYGLLPGLGAAAESASHFRICHALPTRELQSFVLGTDGVLDLTRAEGRPLPGRDDAVRPLHQLWEDDTMFANPDVLRRYVAGVNRETVKLDPVSGAPDRQHGLLPDDTTLIVGRSRRQEPECEEAHQ